MTVNRRAFLRYGGVTGAAALFQRLFGSRREVDAAASPTGEAGATRLSAATSAVWSGDANQTSVQISSYTTGTTLVGLAVSSRADLKNATYLAAEPPNRSGWNKWSVESLTAGTQYHYQITDSPGGGGRRFIGDTAQFKTLQAVGGECTTRIAVGSCEVSAPANPAAFEDIVAWGPDRFVHLGDFGYPANLTTDITTHMDNWSASTSDIGPQSVQSITCMDYIVSDHDGNDNGRSENRPTYQDPITMTNIEAWRRVVPARMADTQSPQHGRWRSDVEGNVRYVKLDTRSIDKTDNVSTPTDPRSTRSSMLGVTQLTWLQRQIDAAASARQLLVLYTDCAWNGTSPGPPIPNTYCDKWPSYIYERDLISDYAAAKGVHVFIVFGDSHGLQQDDGANEKNGFASICCGPLDQELHMHYQDSYQWSYPYNVPEHGGPYRHAQQYQRLTISQVPGSSTVTVTAEARDCSSAVKGTPFTVRTMTKKYKL